MAITREEVVQKYAGLSKQQLEVALATLEKQLKKQKAEIDYNNAMNLSKKLIINGSYGAITTPHFVMFNVNVGASITSQGRELTKTMDESNRHYWYNLWHLDVEAHRLLGIEGRVKPIGQKEHVTIYGDTDSLMVSFKPCINSIQDFDFDEKEFILKIATKVIEPYFLKCLEEHAASYGVKNVQEFELERVNKAMINVAKKKYIQHVVFEDGGHFNELEYFQTKGMEIVRSSTPQFVRERIMDTVKYLFSNEETYNIQTLVSLIKGIRKDFEVADINEIAMQSSVSNYNLMVIEDKAGLEFAPKTHFAVKAAAYHNFILHQHKSLQTKYEFIKSGSKIKYVQTTNPQYPVFAFLGGSFPIEFNVEIDYDTQFEKAFLSPVNSIIKYLDLPNITKRLTVVMDIFAGFGSWDD